MFKVVKVSFPLGVVLAATFCSLCLLTSSEAAERNCQFKRSGSDLFNGVSYDAEFYVVASKYRSTETNKCSIRFVSSRNGGQQPNHPIVITKKSKLNLVKLNSDNDIVYDADKIGDDYFEYERHWNDKNGNPSSAIVKVKVFVGKGPL